MNARQRFAETMAYGTPDRVPYFEEGLRDGVRENWQREGLPKDADLAAMFHFDRRERVPVGLELRGPAEEDPAARWDPKAIRRRLDADDPQRLPDDWADRVAAWGRREHLLELPVHHGFFLTMGVGDWRTFHDVACLLADAPTRVREILDAHAELSARLADRVLREVDVDFVSFSEPIGGSDGPVLSPWTYESIVLASYRPILDVVRRRGVETVVFVTYANARPLLPAVVKAGFNCLWACETNPRAMDYLDLRRQFGRDLRLIGGIDLDALLAGPAAVRREMETRVPPLLAGGGYVPLADGRVRQNVPFETYRLYRRLLEEMTRRA